MILTPEKTLCDKNQGIIVSRDKGSQVLHGAINPKRAFDVRHYQLDGVIIKQKNVVIICSLMIREKRHNIS